MRRILVPVDGSPGAERAVEHVITLKTMGLKMEVQLLHVLPQPEVNDFPDVARAGVAGRLEQGEAEHAFAPAKRLLGEAGIPASMRLASGDPAHEIAQHADIHACTEIVMGTRGRGPIKTLVLGSVATKVLHLVRIPVTLVK
jgi:nucleotide-binding universal stress UspA family protein